jgi:hypothetical protein
MQAMMKPDTLRTDSGIRKSFTKTEGSISGIGFDSIGGTDPESEPGKRLIKKAINLLMMFATNSQAV